MDRVPKTEEGKTNSKRTIPFILMLLILILFLLVLGIVLSTPRNYQINCSLEATEISFSDSSDIKQTFLTIHGVYTSSVFSGQSFSGKIVIEGLPVSNGEMLPIAFCSNQKHYGSLTYRNNDVLEFVGYLRMDKHASEVIICLFENSGDGEMRWSQDKGSVILYPFHDISEYREKLY